MARRNLNENRERADSEEDRAELLERVYEYSRQVPKLSIEQISQLVNRSAASVKLYRAELVKKGRLERTESGQIKISKTAQKEALYQELLKSDFISKYPSMQKWIKKLETGGKKGTGVSNATDLITAFYLVCKTMQVTPDAFLVSVEQTTQIMEDFKALFMKGKAEYRNKSNKIAFRSGANTSIMRYSKAVANFCMRNNKPLPKGLDGAMNRKKENYGAYGTVQHSDKIFYQMLDFLKNHPEGGEEWETLAALHHEMIPRTKTMLRWKNNLQFKTKVIDGVTCYYATSPGVYESKTHKSFDKLILDTRVLELAKKLELGKPIIQNMPLKKMTDKYNNLLREFYASIGLIDPASLNNLINFYKKVEDAERFYLWFTPNYALRHSGCHAWARRCQYNATMIMSLGWDDPNMVIHVYGKMDNEFRLNAGSCLYCNPEGLDPNAENKIFCSWNHTLVYFNNGGKTKKETLELLEQKKKQQTEDALQTIPQIEVSVPGVSA